MLKVQEYLRSGKTLGDLKSEFYVTYRVNEKLNVACLNYYEYRIVPYMSGKNEELIKLYAPYEVEGWSLVFIGERSFTVQREKPSVMSKFFHSLFKVIGYNR